MKKTLISTAVAALLAGPAMAQTMSLDQIQKEIAELKATNDRLQAEVEYLKENAKGERKEAATKAVVLENLNTTVSKFAWSGDFRFRDEEITTAAANNVDEHTRSRQRARLRLGVLAKVNDTINAKIQISTTNSGNDIARSTNQTFGTGWDRKPLSIDQAYADWKPFRSLNVQLGKTPLPWTTTASYFFDKDLTPEGAAVKYTTGPFFAGAYYDWLNERSSSGNQAASADARMGGLQLGIRQPIGKMTLTGAVGYFDLTRVQNYVVAGSTTQTANLTTGAVTTTTCTIDGAFGSGLGTGDNSFGNSTYTGGSAAAGSSTSCRRLLSDFNLLNALIQLDFTIGKYPASAFVDYMQNDKALPSSVAVPKKLDTAFAVGFSFNRANPATPKTWEASFVYQETGKDAAFAQFVDSDFGGGVTDARGWALKGGYVPAANWTLNATYFINQQNYEGVVPTSTIRDLDYKRLQLDLNYRY